MLAVIEELKELFGRRGVVLRFTDVMDPDGWDPETPPRLLPLAALNSADLVIGVGAEDRLPVALVACRAQDIAHICLSGFETSMALGYRWLKKRDELRPLELQLRHFLLRCADHAESVLFSPEGIWRSLPASQL